MLELPIYKVTVSNKNEYGWVRHFINRPNRATIIAVMLADCQKEIDLDEDQDKSGMTAHRYDCLGKLIEEYGLPVPPQNILYCTFAGVEVGQIKVEEKFSVIAVEEQ